MEKELPFKLLFSFDVLLISGIKSKYVEDTEVFHKEVNISNTTFLAICHLFRCPLAFVA